MISDTSFSTEQIDSILIYLKAFQTTGFVFSLKVDPVQDPDGYWVMGYDSLTSLASNFVKATYTNGWILGEFDWSTYCRSAEYERFVFDDGLVDASPEQVAQILTTIIRRDRFASGWLVSAYRDGLLIRLLKRLQAIRNDNRSEL